MIEDNFVIANNEPCSDANCYMMPGIWPDFNLLNLLVVKKKKKTQRSIVSSNSLLDGKVKTCVVSKWQE